MSEWRLAQGHRVEPLQEAGSQVHPWCCVEAWVVAWDAVDSEVLMEHVMCQILMEMLRLQLWAHLDLPSDHREKWVLTKRKEYDMSAF